MTTGKTIALTRQTFVGKVMSLLFNMLSRLIVAFLPRSKCLNFMAAVTICTDFGAPPNKGFYYLNRNLLGLWSHYLNDDFLRETLLEKHFGFGDPQGASVSLSANLGRGLSDSSHLWHPQVLHWNPTGVAGCSIWLRALWEGGFLLVWGPPARWPFLVFLNQISFVRSSIHGSSDTWQGPMSPDEKTKERVGLGKEEIGLHTMPVSVLGFPRVC